MGMTFSRQALITKRATVLIEAESPEGADQKFHQGHYTVVSDETVAWESDGDLVGVYDDVEENSNAATA